MILLLGITISHSLNDRPMKTLFFAFLFVISYTAHAQQRPIAPVCTIESYPGLYCGGYKTPEVVGGETVFFISQQIPLDFVIESIDSSEGCFQVRHPVYQHECTDTTALLLDSPGKVLHEFMLKHGIPPGSSISIYKDIRDEREIWKLLSISY